ncbi:hypothetical protein M0802_003402 [Mischocyttarus mexicanus]|nr:hypothetical protein M0802_003402 [Mischocyttarus mexicanus]
MLKEVIFLVLAALCLSNAVSIKSRTADMDFIHKQKKIYELLFYVKQNVLLDAEFYNAGRDYVIEDNVDMYTNKRIVKDFFYYYKNGVLSRDAVFSLFQEEHRNEVILLFKLFYTAKDFQTFYKTASWARLHLNPEVFSYAFYVAVFYRPDCKYIYPMPPYEANPHYYFDSNVIEEAHRIKMTHGLTPTGYEGHTDTYIIYNNLTEKSYYDEDYKLDYFMEDFGLNSYYYYFRQIFPFWMNSKEYNIPQEFRGIFYLYIHQQLIARYYLERLSNGLGEIGDFDSQKPYYPAFYPSIIYSNGVVMPQRKSYYNIRYYKYYYLKDIDILELRFANAIDSGLVLDNSGKFINIYTPEGLNILGNLIEGNSDSCNSRYYGIYEKYKENLPAYSQQDVSFPGVSIDSVNIDKLWTYFDYCDATINNAVFFNNFKEGSSLVIKARRNCLNYKPFTYHFNINSNKDTKAIVKIFLGPALENNGEDLSYIYKYYKYFVELDQFVVSLKPGANNIDRKSSESVYTMPDMTSSDSFYKKLEKAASGSEPFTYYEKLYAFPERLTLPKGTPEETISNSALRFIFDKELRTDRTYGFGKGLQIGAYQVRTADKAYLIKQKSIYELFWHVDQPTNYHPELYQTARSYSIQDHIDSYTNKTVVEEFLQRWNYGMLPRGRIFSIMYPQLQEEAICFFNLLYTAKDFETFYNTAVWGRFNMNEQMYIYALSVAVLHRSDTKYMRIPPLYEVAPHFFYNSDVLHKVYHLGVGDTNVKKTVGGTDYYLIPTNYTGWYLQRNNVPEQKLSYFTEDVGLGQYYFMINHDFPYWMNSAQYKLPTNVRGEMYLHGHKQLLGRYYLEKLSNDMGEIEYVDFYKPITTGYYPTMHYSNGVPYPERETDAVVPLSKYEYVKEAEHCETRISYAIDSGYFKDVTGKLVNVYTQEGLNILGNIIQGNADTINPKLYGQYDILMRKIFGFSLKPASKYQISPSALEIYSSSTRDPVFYSTYKNIVNYYLNYKKNMPCYTHEELAFSGVKIESVAVDKLMTFFDQYESLLSNVASVKNHKEAQSMLIKARQYRLNHKPFTYHITVVNSDTKVKGVVRIFLGPKYDVHGTELDISENYMNFIQLDQWVVDLKVGTNKIERHSHESSYVVPDEVSSEVLYKKILKGIDGSETYTYTTKPYGFPDRLMLPKGKKEGMPFKLFVHIAPYDETKSYQIESPVWGTYGMDGRPMGYPLDKPVHAYNFTLPNLYFKDVVIFHKQLEELNVTV